MSKFLRDTALKNLTISEKALQELNADIVNIVTKENNALEKKSDGVANAEYIDNLIFASYTIRFDGNGFKLSDFTSILKYFREAKNVERFLIEINSYSSKNGLKGKKIDLLLNAEPADNRGYLCVQDDDKDWVDLNFVRLKNRLDKHKNFHYLIRNRWTVMAFQIVGTLGIFSLSFWISNKMSPYININNSLIFCFIASFLLLATLWAHAYEIILQLIGSFFPNIKFREGKYDWFFDRLYQTAIISVTLFLMKTIFGYLWVGLNTLIKR